MAWRRIKRISLAAENFVKRRTLLALDFIAIEPPVATSQDGRAGPPRHRWVQERASFGGDRTALCLGSSRALISRASRYIGLDESLGADGHHKGRYALERSTTQAGALRAELYVKFTTRWKTRDETQSNRARIRMPVTSSMHHETGIQRREGTSKRILVRRETSRATWPPTTSLRVQETIGNPTAGPAAPRSRWGLKAAERILEREGRRLRVEFVVRSRSRATSPISASRRYDAPSLRSGVGERPRFLSIVGNADSEWMRSDTP